jgi:hypothetical protein
MHGDEMKEEALRSALELSTNDRICDLDTNVFLVERGDTKTPAPACSYEYSDERYIVVDREERDRMAAQLARSSNLTDEQKRHLLSSDGVEARSGNYYIYRMI